MSNPTNLCHRPARILIVLIFIAALLSVPPAQPACAATLTVTNTNNSGAGSLRQAVLDANSGDTIHFHASLAGMTITLSSQITIDKNLTIDGSTLSSRIRISGDGLTRVFEISSAKTVNLNSLEIMDGLASGPGGGIRNAGYLSITDCAFSGNTSDCSLLCAGSGGAIRNDQNGNLSITNSSFSDNSSEGAYGGSGGAIANYHILSIDQTEFINNSAEGDGGAVYSVKPTSGNNTTVTVTNSTFSGNNTDETGFGGGIYIDGEDSPYGLQSTLTISNGTFYGNSAHNGGGIYSHDTTLTVSGSTISGNTGPDLLAPGGLTGYGPVHLLNSIVANNIGGDCDAVLATDINNLIGYGYCNWDGTDDPLLGPLADNGGLTQTMALLAGSPAIDAGDDATCEEADQRGLSRPQGAHCDIGAYESAYALTVNSLNDPGTESCDSTECTLREAATWIDPGGVIAFDPALAGGLITLTGEIALQKDMTIDGLSVDPRVQISGDDSSRVFHINNGADVDINGLEITHGGGVVFGGGIYNEGSLQLAESIVSGSNATNIGGGIFNADSLYVQDSTISSNGTNLYGGGIYNNGTLTVLRSTFQGNDAGYLGGAIYASTSTSNTVRNSTFHNNSADDEGGGFYSSSGTVTISNSTFYGNYADLTGAGVRNSGGTLHLLNSILAYGSGSSDCASSNTLATNTNNLVEDGSCSPDRTGNPLLGALMDNGGPTKTMALSASSPALDAGDDATCEATDQRGVSRPQGSHCDIGAFELEPAFPYSLYLPLIMR